MAPGTSLLQEDDAAGQAGTATFVEEAAMEAVRRVKVQRDRLEAIDSSLGAWTKESPRALRSLLPIAPAKAITRSLTPFAQNAPGEGFGSTALLSRLVEFDEQGVLCPAEYDDRSQQQEIRVSRMVTLAALSATALLARESLLRRSSFLAAGASSPDEKAGWQGLFRHRDNPVNRARDRWRKRR